MRFYICKQKKNPTLPYPTLLQTSEMTAQEHHGYSPNIVSEIIGLSGLKKNA